MVAESARGSRRSSARCRTSGQLHSAWRRRGWLCVHQPGEQVDPTRRADRGRVADAEMARGRNRTRALRAGYQIHPCESPSNRPSSRTIERLAMLSSRRWGGMGNGSAFACCRRRQRRLARALLSSFSSTVGHRGSRSRANAMVGGRSCETLRTSVTISERARSLAAIPRGARGIPALRIVVMSGDMEHSSWSARARRRRSSPEGRSISRGAQRFAGALGPGREMIAIVHISAEVCASYWPRSDGRAKPGFCQGIHDHGFVSPRSRSRNASSWPLAPVASEPISPRQKIARFERDRVLGRFSPSSEHRIDEARRRIRHTGSRNWTVRTPCLLRRCF